ncbi:glycosyltransferase family 2 protein [Flavobacterium sp. HBTb2-11-1]|uniref:glycosyltransferase family 2 protein n=1 Tax=Flavobacterium sp. HBTb2-11-1 TaxID=2692212 RepID=UPI00136C665D|nr:glycosyltransferase family 2 protein [Flavobacterium sp. HBTb2-11-1]MXO06000.1 glycosyltransferase [Flavobacterium sp. HBTb2-11-1]
MLAILLSTYNGENYLREQLDSIFSQTFKDFILYVRDDGSLDNTVNILYEYEKEHANFAIINDNQKRKGASGSFMCLLEKVEADYYMFCDQDDIWFSSKIQTSLNAIQAEELRSKDMPILVHTDLIVTDNNLNVISKSLWKNNNTNPYIITRKYLKFVNYITGCTMLFNRITRDLAILDSKNIIMHDFWVGVCVDSVKGIIITLPIPTIYYRQHSNNVIGASKSHRFPTLVRYFHVPDFRYSIDLYNMIKHKYSMNFFQYLMLRIRFYLKSL